MKIRNGFVSNSSSSSFVLCLPKGFFLDLNSKRVQLIMEDYKKRFNDQNIDNQSIIKAYKIMLKTTCYYGCDFPAMVFLLRDILKDYIIYEFRHNPEEVNSIAIVNRHKVYKIIGDRFNRDFVAL